MNSQTKIAEIILASLQARGWRPEPHIKTDVLRQNDYSFAFVWILQYQQQAPMALLMGLHDKALPAQAIQSAAELLQELNLPFAILGYADGCYLLQVAGYKEPPTTTKLLWTEIPTPEQLWQQFSIWAFNGRSGNDLSGGESACPLGMGQ